MWRKLRSGPSGRQQSGSMRSVWYSLFVATVLGVSCLSLLPSSELPAVSVSDKVAHLAAYLLLGALGCHVSGSGIARFVVAAFLIALGIGLEFAQTLVPGRTTETLDALFNVIGVGGGIALAAFFDDAPRFSPRTNASPPVRLGDEADC